MLFPLPLNKGIEINSFMNFDDIKELAEALYIEYNIDDYILSNYNKVLRYFKKLLNLYLSIVKQSRSKNVATWYRKSEKYLIKIDNILIGSEMRNYTDDFFS